MSSVDALSEADRQTLLRVARAAIASGLRTGRAPDGVHDAESLGSPRGCFVTLHLDGALRGCVGSLRPRGPLVGEVARAAYMAAFNDPRFPPVTEDEVERLLIHVSVLSTPMPVAVRSEADLVQSLRPNIDGVILHEGARLGTFLPDVWRSIPDPVEFVKQLKLKAGFSVDYWSDDIEVERYVTESFE